MLKQKTSQNTIILLIVIAFAGFALTGLSIKASPSKKANIRKRIASVDKNKPSGMKMLPSQNPNSINEWVNEWKNVKKGNLTPGQAKNPKNAAFALKFPDDYSLTGKLEVVHNGGGQGNAGTDITMIFSKGYEVDQILPDPIEAKGLPDFADYITTNEDTKNIFKKVNVNGVKDWAAESEIEHNIPGRGEYKTPACVSWYKNGILYTIYAEGDKYENRKTSIGQLLKIAKLFD